MASVSACVSHSAPTWYAADQYDKFKNESSCRASIGSESVGAFTYTFNGQYYPFIERTGDNVYVGISSVPLAGANVTTFRPSAPIPVGDVELKVDGNETWVLAAAESPVHTVAGSSSELMRQQTQQQIAAMAPANPQLAGSLAAMQDSMRGMTAPYTAASGDKARQIIDQMRAGRVVAFRATMAMGGISKSFEYPLTGLREQLARCGI